MFLNVLSVLALMTLISLRIFGPALFLVSIPCCLFSIASIKLKKDTISMFYLLEAMIGIFFFLASGPLMIKWLIDRPINILEIAGIWFFQLVLLMYAIGKKWSWLDKFAK